MYDAAHHNQNPAVALASDHITLLTPIARTPKQADPTGKSKAFATIQAPGVIPKDFRVGCQGQAVDVHAQQHFIWLRRPSSVTTAAAFLSGNMQDSIGELRIVETEVVSVTSSRGLGYPAKGVTFCKRAHVSGKRRDEHAAPQSPRRQKLPRRLALAARRSMHRTLCKNTH